MPDRHSVLERRSDFCGWRVGHVEHAIFGLAQSDLDVHSDLVRRILSATLDLRIMAPGNVHPICKTVLCEARFNASVPQCFPHVLTSHASKRGIIFHIIAPFRGNVKKGDIKVSVFGSRLISARKRKGMTQAQLASAIGVSRSGLSGYETEGKDASYEVLCKIVKELGVSADYLIGLDDDAVGGLKHIAACFYNLESKYANATPERRDYADRLLSDMNEILEAVLEGGDEAMLKVCADLLRTARNFVKTPKQEQENE